MKKDYLRDFALAGGTSLALRFGHRTSVDIDLFSPIHFNPELLQIGLGADFEEIEFTGNNRFMMFCYINQVKTDFVFHPHPILNPLEEVETIRMFSLEDVTAMKLSAIARRGSKKDFYDLWQLLQVMTPKQIIDTYSEKYGEGQVWMLLNSITYFTDADPQAAPLIFVKNLSWNKVKSDISKAYKNYPV